MDNNLAEDIDLNEDDDEVPDIGYAGKSNEINSKENSIKPKDTVDNDTLAVEKLSDEVKISGMLSAKPKRKRKVVEISSRTTTATDVFDISDDEDIPEIASIKT